MTATDAEKHARLGFACAEGIAYSIMVGMAVVGHSWFLPDLASPLSILTVSGVIFMWSWARERVQKLPEGTHDEHYGWLLGFDFATSALPIATLVVTIIIMLLRPHPPGYVYSGPWLLHVTWIFLVVSRSVFSDLRNLWHIVR